MPSLTRSAPKLLKIVKDQQHATEKDHEDGGQHTYPTPSSTDSTRASKTMQEEDIFRDPESSDDESSNHGRRVTATGFLIPSRRDEIEEVSVKKPVFKRPSSTFSQTSTGSKRSAEGAGLASSDIDDYPFAPSGSRKKQKSPRATNIHAAPSKKNKRMYGASSQRQSSQTSRNNAKLKAPKADISDKPKTPPKPQFKMPKHGDMFEFGATEPRPALRASRASAIGFEDDVASSHSLSPSLSSLSSAPDSPEVQEIESLNLPEPVPYEPKTTCTLCGEEVDLFLKQNFEDEYLEGKLMNYKWQQRFCRYHKQHEARQLWTQRRYPEIDWSGLERRMRRYHLHLKNVMRGETASHYRDLLDERLKGRTKTTLQSLDNDRHKREPVTGYYGPRGEKVMYVLLLVHLMLIWPLTASRTDHIIAHLSDDLRKAASRDKLIAASGVSGGVSGFIQAVLVPELAVQLIGDDSSIDERRARDVIAESADLGELLHPDLDDKVTEAMDEGEAYS